MSNDRKRRINNRTVNALSVETDTVFWDRRLAGFGVRAYPSGARVYIAQARGPGGARRVTLGRHGVVHADRARRRAAAAIARIVAGEDPLPQRTAAKAGAGPTVPCALIRRLAVDRSCHGAGLGQLLVADAIKRILSAGDSVAMHAVIVDAKNEAAKAFYERLGFTPLPSRPARLFLPLGSARLTSRAR